MKVLIGSLADQVETFRNLSNFDADHPRIDTVAKGSDKGQNGIPFVIMNNERVPDALARNRKLSCLCASRCNETIKIYSVVPVAYVDIKFLVSAIHHSVSKRANFLTYGIINFQDCTDGFKQ